MLTRHQLTNETPSELQTAARAYVQGLEDEVKPQVDKGKRKALPVGVQLSISHQTQVP